MEKVQGAPAAPADGYLPGPQVNARYSIHPTTRLRWENDPAMGFPAPLKINRRSYWRIADLEQWERSRVAARAVA